jgi:hypothetical protein
MAVIIIVVIVVALVIIIETQNRSQKPFQVLTYGLLWSGTTWTCTSDADYIIHGTLRGGTGAQLAISISDLGTQALYTLDPGKMQTFTVGSPGNHTMTISKTNTVTGWFTLQTFPDVKASCVQS